MNRGDPRLVNLSFLWRAPLRPLAFKTHRVSVLVPDNLNLNVPRLDDELLNQETVVAERREGLGLGETEGFSGVFFVPVGRAKRRR